jgi:hypothetical protein
MVRMLEHVVGPLLPHGVQECGRCGEVLTDYRNAMVPEGSPPLQGIAVGERWVRKVGENGASVGMSREFTSELVPACDPLLEHVAGEPQGRRQDCSRCGVVLGWSPAKGGPNPDDFAPVGEAVVATATVVCSRSAWAGPTRVCGGKAP